MFYILIISTIFNIKRRLLIYIFDNVKDEILLPILKRSKKNHSGRTFQIYSSSLQICKYLDKLKKIFCDKNKFLSSSSSLSKLNSNQDKNHHIQLKPSRNKAQSQKRESIITNIELCQESFQKNLKTFGKKQRNSVLDTKNLIIDEKILMHEIKKISMKPSQTELNKQNVSPFDQCQNKPRNSSQFPLHQFDLQNSSKIAHEFFLLEKKKMLKNIKPQIQKRKIELWQEIEQNRKRHKRQHQQQKKQISKRALKKSQIKCFRNSQSCKGNFFASDFSNLKDKQNTDQFNAILNFNKNKREDYLKQQNDKQDQNKKFEFVSKHQNNENIKAIKEYINFFKQEANQNRYSRFSYYCRSNDMQTSKFIKYQADISKYGKFRSFRRKSQIQHRYSDASKSARKKKTDQKDDDKQNQSTTEPKDLYSDDINHESNPSLLNAKMRIRSNHKKIVNLGKMQKINNTLTKYSNENRKQISNK